MNHHDIEHHAREVVEERVVAMERARVLRDRVEQTTERRPRLAVNRMRVRRRDHIGPSCMNLRVDRERRTIDGRVPFDHLAGVAHEQQIGHADLLETLPEWVHPKVVEEFRIPSRDVAGDSFVEPELAEQTERGREDLLAV
jgi:hypothetical protein